MLKRVSLFVLLFLCIGIGQSFAYNAELSPFSDLTKEDWATKSIYKLSAINIISGFPDKTFRENEPLTREAFIKMLVSSDKGMVDGERDISLKDVNKTKWSYPFIKESYDLGLIDFMIKDGLFLPESNITRGEVAIIIGQYLLKSISEEEAQNWLTSGWQTEETKRQFVDHPDVDLELKPFFYYSSFRGIMVGDQTGGFRSHDSLTRKEAAVIIDRMINEQIKDHNLDAIGFYAIKSYNNIDKLDLLTSVIFGWSHLEYTDLGKASLNLTSTEYSFPLGWENVLTIANEQQINKELMIFADNTSSLISRFLNDAPAQEAFILSLKETLLDPKYEFTGVCIDFEGLKEVTDQALYLSFLQELKSSIGNLSLSVTVPPIDYYKGYDLKGIGEVADQVIVMAYDYTHKDSKLPSAPLPLVNDAITTALQFIPNDKIVLGISKQANQWIESPDGGITLLNPSIDLVEDRKTKKDSVIQFSYPYFLTNIQYMNQGSKNSIWYEDSQSIEQKIWLSKYYGLKGVSFWHIGNYTAKDWDVMKQMNKSN